MVSLGACSFAALHLFHSILDININQFSKHGVSAMIQACDLQQRINQMVNSLRQGPGLTHFLNLPLLMVFFLAGVQWMFAELSSHPVSFILFT